MAAEKLGQRSVTAIQIVRHLPKAQQALEQRVAAE
jgi:hypothetical protein